MRKGGTTVLALLGALVLVLGLIGASAVAGRAFLPNSLVVFGTNASKTPSTPSPTSPTRARVLELKRDFDALAATIRDVAASTGGYRLRDDLTMRIETLRQELRTLPDSPSRDRYIAAAKFLADPIPDLGVPVFAPAARDAVNRAEAEWRKGDDLLK